MPFWYLEEGRFSVYVQEFEDSSNPTRKRYLEQIYHEGDSLDEENYYLVVRYTRLQDFVSQVRELRALTKKKPHPKLPYHILQLVYSFCVVLRHHDGDLLNDGEGVF